MATRNGSKQNDAMPFKNKMDAVLTVDALRLRFQLYPYAPEEFRRRWERLKDAIECGSQKTGRCIMARWVEHCRVDSNRRLPVLHRQECGIGGDNNQTDKQIRFLRSRSDIRHPHDITADYIRNGLSGKDEAEKWSYEEITDLVGAFCACLCELLEEECVNGFIEIKVPCVGKCERNLSHEHRS